MARPQRIVPKAEEFVRPKRPVRNIEPEGPFGAWMKNPPSDCPNKRQDCDGFWVECVICAYECKSRNNCPVWLKIKEGSKERIKNSGR